METISRRVFIKKVSMLCALLPFSALISSSKKSSRDFLKYQSKFLKVRLNRYEPVFDYLSVDSLGTKKLAINPVIKMANSQNVLYTSQIYRNKIEYRLAGVEDYSAIWTFEFDDRIIRITSNFSSSARKIDPLEIVFDQSLNHVTLLGLMDEKSKVRLPCVMHLPDMGTFRIKCNVNDQYLDYDARRYVQRPFVKISFPAANERHRIIEYTLRVIAIYPEIKGIENDVRFNGFKRNFINIFQINPHLRVLANNSSSDPCAFTVYKSSEVALLTPPLVEGLTAMDLVRMTLDRYLKGMKAYGLVGYTDNYEGADTAAWRSQFNSLDSYPSLLIAACNYINSSNDIGWAKTNFKRLKEWAQGIADRDKDKDGLIEYELSGNSGSWNIKNPEAEGAKLEEPGISCLSKSKTEIYCVQVNRPANWWDTIGFAHKDAYSNALAYRAFLLFSKLALKVDHPEVFQFYREKADKIKSVYFNTFYNPVTGILAGWKSKDGKLHDYYFTFINSIAVLYGLVPEDKCKRIMDTILEKMQEVGFTDFSLGLPGNLIPIRKEDYTEPTQRWGGPQMEDGSDGFQIYENGGATACYAYFTIKALYKTGKRAMADQMLFELLKSFEEGNFQGKCSDGMSKDWKTWKGKCWGYEGFLADGYLALLAALRD